MKDKSCIPSIYPESVRLALVDANLLSDHETVESLLGKVLIFKITINPVKEALLMRESFRKTVDLITEVGAVNHEFIDYVSAYSINSFIIGAIQVVGFIKNNPTEIGDYDIEIRILPADTWLDDMYDIRYFRIANKKLFAVCIKCDSFDAVDQESEENLEMDEDLYNHTPTPVGDYYWIEVDKFSVFIPCWTKYLAQN